ncbi:tRNA (cmo5U34)-methyltransferase [Sphingobacterium psychroaquaticum]|uniref:tRNA (Cmo5U34)-methyltransferase n=2 Tax=Sphingobacterium psychroaquaticum TaxID=561061 RepID=A0A1X7JJU3_9SPHI|nr:tRNA (cmo5U34)-methyltransferase [Sphingobacterium psychroaquaticum]
MRKEKTMKSTLLEIEQRFDADVERFSNLETGQQTTLDAAFNMELITTSIARMYPQPIRVLDIGCGAGNYMVKLLQKKKSIDITLVDLSQPMLDRALARVGAVNAGTTDALKGDFRTIDLKEGAYDVIVTTAVLHHLRDDADWADSFGRLYRLLKPGGSLWVFDLIQQHTAALQDYIYKDLYGTYLTGLKDEAYRDAVFAYIEKEDSPRSLVYQLDLLRSVGFSTVDILHKNLCFASYVGMK